MVVGRAGNGWDEGYTGLKVHKTGTEMQTTKDALEYLRYSPNPDGCPMAWVTDQQGPNEIYNTNNSAFWRVAAAVLEGLCGPTPEGRRWSSRLAWSNLYKIAPAGGGNPGARLCARQEGLAIELLEQEIRDFEPKHILFLSADSWASSHLMALGAKDDGPYDPPLERAGTIDLGSTSSRFAVLPHPERKSESPIVSAAIAALALPSH